MSTKKRQKAWRYRVHTVPSSGCAVHQSLRGTPQQLCTPEIVCYNSGFATKRRTPPPWINVVFGHMACPLPPEVNLRDEPARELWFRLWILQAHLDHCSIPAQADISHSCSRGCSRAQLEAWRPGGRSAPALSPGLSWSTAHCLLNVPL